MDTVKLSVDISSLGIVAASERIAHLIQEYVDANPDVNTLMLMSYISGYLGAWSETSARKEHVPVSEELAQVSEEPVSIEEESVQVKEDPVQVKEEPVSREEDTVQASEEPVPLKEVSVLLKEQTPVREEKPHSVTPPKEQRPKSPGNTKTSSPPRIPPKDQMCLFARGCLNSSCKRIHPEGYVHPCRFQERCKKAACTLRHPAGRTPLCENKDTCENIECTLLHSKEVHEQKSKSMVSSLESTETDSEPTENASVLSRVEVVSDTPVAVPVSESLLLDEILYEDIGSDDERPDVPCESVEKTPLASADSGPRIVSENMDLDLMSGRIFSSGSVTPEKMSPESVQSSCEKKRKLCTKETCKTDTVNESSVTRDSDDELPTRDSDDELHLVDKSPPVVKDVSSSVVAPTANKVHCSPKQSGAVDKDLSSTTTATVATLGGVLVASTKTPEVRALPPKREPEIRASPPKREPDVKASPPKREPDVKASSPPKREPELKASVPPVKSQSVLLGRVPVNNNPNDANSKASQEQRRPLVFSATNPMRTGPTKSFPRTAPRALFGKKH